MKHCRQYILLILMCVSASAFGQATDVDSHFNTWFSVKAKVDLSDRFYINSQISLRRYDFLKSWQKIILRTRGHYKLNDFVNLGIGYTYSKNFEPDQAVNIISVPRSDLFSEFAFTNTYDGLKLVNRFRLEHRFTGNLVVPDDINEKSYINGSKFTNRLRYRITAKYPLLKNNDGSTKLYIVGFYELFLRMDKKFKILNISGNIFKIVAGYPISSLVTFEGGFRRSIRHDRNYVSKEVNTTLDISLKYRFDFKDKFSKHVTPVFQNLFHD